MRYLKNLKNIFFCFSLLCALNVYAQIPDKVIAFGDSLTDTGNVYALTWGAIPKGKAYYQGRFSNGPAWIEYLVQELSLNPNNRSQFLNYAYGGAWAEPYAQSGHLLPYDLTAQVAMYRAAALFDWNIDKHLFVIFIGGNDYFGEGEEPTMGRDDVFFATTNTVKYISDQMEVLMAFGAKKILVINLPDLGQTPFGRTRPEMYRNNEAELTHWHNEKLFAAVANARLQHADVKITLIDMYAYMTDMMANPAKYGLENTTEACYTGKSHDVKLAQANLNALKKMHLNVDRSPILNMVYQNGEAQTETTCAKPEVYLYWDRAHPTTTVNAAFAKMVFRELNRT